MFTCGPAFFLPVTSSVVSPYLVYDTFIGTGLLSDHIGEIGTPWTVGANTYTLSGGLVCPTNATGEPTYAAGSSLFLEGYVEIAFTYTP